MRNITLARAAIVLTVVAGGVQGGWAVAMPAVTVTCGEVVTTSITVANDLTCPGDALSVEAENGATLDLGGHTIRGGGAGTGVLITAPNGDPQISNVTITHGTITEFASAVHIVDGFNTTLSRLTLTDNGGATDVIATGPRTFTEGLLITKTEITGNKGRVISGSTNVGGLVVSQTKISGGDIFLSQTGGPTFTDDTFTDVPMTLNIEGFTTINGGTFVRSPIVDNGFGFGHDVFQNATFSGSATALTLADVSDQQLVGDTFSDNGIGVSISDSPGDTISGTTFTHNSTAGVYYVDGGVMGSGTLTVSGNTAKANGKNPQDLQDPGGIQVEGGIFLYAPLTTSTINDNQTAHNGGYGIFLQPPVPGSGNSFSAQGNVSTGDFGKCFPLNLCTYN
jgi:Right handed beta helix region